MNRTAAFASIVLALALCLALPGRPAASQSSNVPPAPIDHPAYAIGHQLGVEARDGLARDEVNANLDVVIRGFTDGLKGGPGALTADQMEDALIALQRQVGERRAQDRLANDPVFKAVAEENLKRSRLFLDRFAKKEGAKSLEGGIFYLPVKTGQGAFAKAADTVVVTYQIKLTTGDEIASAVDQELRVASVPPGAQTVLTNMRPGDRWLVAIPPDLAHGVAGREPVIGPNETMVVDVEFVRVK